MPKLNKDQEQAIVSFWIEGMMTTYNDVKEGRVETEDEKISAYSVAHGAWGMVLTLKNQGAITQKAVNAIKILKGIIEKMIASGELPPMSFLREMGFPSGAFKESDPSGNIIPGPWKGMDGNGQAKKKKKKRRRRRKDSS